MYILIFGVHLCDYLPDLLVFTYIHVKKTNCGEMGWSHMNIPANSFITFSSQFYKPLPDEVINSIQKHYLYHYIHLVCKLKAYIVGCTSCTLATKFNTAKLKLNAGWIEICMDERKDESLLMQYPTTDDFTELRNGHKNNCALFICSHFKLKAFW